MLLKAKAARLGGREITLLDRGPRAVARPGEPYPE
jgi:hypothetical protein